MDFVGFKNIRTLNYWIGIVSPMLNKVVKLFHLAPVSTSIGFRGFIIFQGFAVLRSFLLLWFRITSDEHLFP